MKVLHVLGELNHSGAERMLACSAEHWRSAGVKAIVVGMANGSHRFSATLEQAGYEVLILPDARSVRGIRALARTIRAHRPQVVHVHAERCFDLVSIAAVTAPSVEVVVRTVHSQFRFAGQLQARRRLRVGVARRLGVTWIACSPEVAENERSYQPGRSVSVIENWVDVDGFRTAATAEAGSDIRHELGIERDVPVFAVIGNCGGAKNHEFLPSVLGRVETPTHLLHVGRRRDEPQAEVQAWHALPERHVVHHLGERDDVPALLAASDLMLLPSLYEGRSLVALEALCAAVPILASDTPGQKWLREFRSATVLPLDASDWSAAVSQELTGHRGRQAAAEVAAFAQAKFAPERGVTEYLNAYHSARRIRRGSP